MKNTSVRDDKEKGAVLCFWHYVRHGGLMEVFEGCGQEGALEHDIEDPIRPIEVSILKDLLEVEEGAESVGLKDAPQA